MLVAALFTRNAGQPATGLALADISLYLYSRNKATAAIATLWTAVQPTEEVGAGFYTRDYAAADPTLFDYFAYAEYTGAVALDSDFATQITGAEAIDVSEIWGYATRTLTACGVGAIEFTYTLTDSDTGLPIGQASVWFSTDSAGANVIWRGATDNFGVARDAWGQKPWLDPGTYYVWRRKVGYTFHDPDVEHVS